MLLAAALSAAAFAPPSARAQIAPPPNMQPVIPFPTAPPPPPPPRIEVPEVPRMNSPPPFELQNTQPGRVHMDAPPKQNLKPLSRRRSFSKRVTRCLEEGAAMGYDPNGRAAYSRSCVNQ